MENSNDVKHLAYFPRQWLAKVLTQCRAVGGLMSYQGFMADWMALGQKLYKFGYNYGDEFNEFYKKKKHLNKKQQESYGKEKEDDSHH